MYGVLERARVPFIWKVTVFRSDGKMLNKKCICGFSRARAWMMRYAILEKYSVK